MLSESYINNLIGTSTVFPKFGQASQPLTFEVIASGLDSPRGLTFGSHGALYVAEAGFGGSGVSIPSPSVPGAQISYGASGAITRIQDGEVKRIITGLPSLALPDGSDASGIHDIEFDANGNAYGIFGFASNPEYRDPIINVPEFGNFVAINDIDGQASFTRLADLAAYELNNNPDGGDVISNPYDLLIQGNTAYVIDAGGNDLLSSNIDGSELKVNNIFPTGKAKNPTTGEEISYQAVPTAVAPGSDGALYVSQLTGFPFPEGQAQIFRIDSDGKQEVYASGFTNIVDLAFDKSGGLFVLEYDSDGIASGDSKGALVYLPPEGNTRLTITSDNLISPTGLTIGPDNNIYISNKGFTPGEGEVIRFENPFNRYTPSILGRKY